MYADASLTGPVSWTLGHAFSLLPGLAWDPEEVGMGESFSTRWLAWLDAILMSWGQVPDAIRTYLPLLFPTPAGPLSGR